MRNKGMDLICKISWLPCWYYEFLNDIQKASTFLLTVLLRSFSKELMALAQLLNNIIWPNLHAGLGYTARSLPCFSTYSLKTTNKHVFLAQQHTCFSLMMAILPWWMLLRSVKIILRVSDPSAQSHTWQGSICEMW